MCVCVMQLLTHDAILNTSKNVHNEFTRLSTQSLVNNNNIIMSHYIIDIVIKGGAR